MAEHTPDDQLIDAEIRAAQLAQREVDDATARAIAAQLHGGARSALASLATSGALVPGLHDELAALGREDNPRTRKWVDMLGTYAIRRQEQGPVAGWHELWPRAEPPAADELEREPNIIEICVASLDDEAAGRSHDVWLDATLDPDELHEGVQHMLRNSYVPAAERYEVRSYVGFHGVELGEHPSLELISKVANALYEHGEPVAHYIEWLGHPNEEMVERFEDHYRGQWDSFEDFINDYVDWDGLYHQLEAFPERSAAMDVLREHLAAELAPDWASDYHVVDSNDGEHVFVFRSNA